VVLRHGRASIVCGVTVTRPEQLGADNVIETSDHRIDTACGDNQVRELPEEFALFLASPWRRGVECFTARGPRRTSPAHVIPDIHVSAFEYVFVLGDYV
jgi:hypothetical protein